MGCLMSPSLRQNGSLVLSLILAFQLSFAQSALSTKPRESSSLVDSAGLPAGEMMSKKLESLIQEKRSLGMLAREAFKFSAFLHPEDVRFLESVVSDRTVLLPTKRISEYVLQITDQEKFLLDLSQIGKGVVELNGKRLQLMDARPLSQQLQEVLVVVSPGDPRFRLFVETAHAALVRIAVGVALLVVGGLYKFLTADRESKKIADLVNTGSCADLSSPGAQVEFLIRGSEGKAERKNWLMVSGDGKSLKVKRGGENGWTTVDKAEARVIFEGNLNETVRSLVDKTPTERAEILAKALSLYCNRQLIRTGETPAGRLAGFAERVANGEDHRSRTEVNLPPADKRPSQFKAGKP